MKRKRRRKKRIKWKKVIILFGMILLSVSLFCYQKFCIGDNQKEKNSAAQENSRIYGRLIADDFHINAEEMKQRLAQSKEETVSEVKDVTTKQLQKVKGIYVTGPMAGSQYMDDLIALVDETELNTMVIDIKNDDGRITYRMDLEQANNMEACIRYIPDMETFMAKLKEHDIYTIARVVCFKDPCLAKAHPEYTIKNPDGSPLTDKNGMAWINPYEKDTWEYIVDVSVKAADLGFDEIQFDYVRFPEGKAAQNADYGVDTQNYTKEQVILDFLTYAAERLHEKDIVLGADVFGTVIHSNVDAGIVGQDYKEIGSIVDVICPMVYPSHYQNGTFGLKVPDAYPYETVYEAMKDSAKKLEAVEETDRAVVRPWLQSFTAGWVTGHIPYGGEEIRKQIQAVYDAGYDEWILWDASNRYTKEGLEN